MFADCGDTVGIIYEEHRAFEPGRESFGNRQGVLILR